MRAVAFSQFGGPEVLRVVELAAPHPGPGQVRIRVAAASVNPADAVMRSGQLPAMLEGQAYFVPGMDAAGVVDEVGEGAGWAVGDEVMAVVLPPVRGGAYAEHIVVPASSIARVPAGVGLVAASTLPMNGLTARLSLDQLALAPGETIAVTGAAGAYGGYVIQLAKADGLRVIADASEADEQLVRSLGAHHVVRRGDDVAQRVREIMPSGVDGCADGAVLERGALVAVKDGGGLAVVRTERDLAPAPGRWERTSERGVTVHTTTVSEYANNHAALDILRQQVEAGVITLRVAATYPAELAPEAHRRLEAGGTRGRLVLTFGPMWN